MSGPVVRITIYRVVTAGQERDAARTTPQALLREPSGEPEKATGIISSRQYRKAESVTALCFPAFTKSRKPRRA